MESIISYFKKYSHQNKFKVNDAEVKRNLSALNHQGRKKLRERILKEAAEMSSDKTTINWLQSCFEELDKYAFRLHKVYFSPGTEIGETLSNLLRDAEDTVQICVFTITDNRLAREILNCHRRGLKVEVITDDQKIFDRSSEIQDMRQSGIDIKIDHSQYHMHNKFGIIDNKIVFTGSFNWTYTASKHNQENLLVTTNGAIVQQFSEEFDKLWNEMYTL